MNNTLLYIFLGLVLVVSCAFLFINKNKPTEEALTFANIQNQSEVMEPVVLSSSAADATVRSIDYRLVSYCLNTGAILTQLALYLIGF